MLHEPSAVFEEHRSATKTRLLARRCPRKDVKTRAGTRLASHRPRGSVYLAARLWTHFLSMCFGLNHTALRHHEAAEDSRREPEASDVIVFLYNRGRACKQASMDT